MTKKKWLQVNLEITLFMMLIANEERHGNMVACQKQSEGGRLFPVTNVLKVAEEIL